jgi:hypothetical protein
MTSFKDEIARFRSGNNFDAAYEECLERLEEDWRIEKVWKKVQTEALKRHLPLFPEFFIQEILTAWAVAEWDYAPDYLAHGSHAEALIQFLKGPPGRPPRVPGTDDHMRMLEDLAHKLRERASVAPGPIRRKDRSRQRQQRTFIRLMTETMNSLCGRPMHDEVLDLTEAVFLRQDMGIHRLRAALRPTTRKGRSGKR